MHICMVHNAYGRPSGEEAVVHAVKRLICAHGHQLTAFERSSAEIERLRFGKARAFFSGIYSPSSRGAFRELVARRKPDLVHVNNLYPLISPSILPECRRAGIPVVMTVHNYRLVCPNGLHLVRGNVCEKCVGGREYCCVLNRCEGSFAKSTGYALRSVFARKARLFHRNVTLYATLTQFQRHRLMAAGFDADRITVIGNIANGRKASAASGQGEYVGYVGRISPEKGIMTLLEAARSLPNVQFKAAGFLRSPALVHEAPANFTFLGQLDGSALDDFYRRSRMIALCSTCYEGFPTVLIEAMLHSKPIVCSRVGGMPEIVHHNTTGMLFKPGDARELAETIQALWNSPARCQRLGSAGEKKAAAEYLPERYYERLMSVYERAIELGPGGRI